MVKEAEKHFVMQKQNAAPNKPWSTKDIGFAELKNRFPRLSRKKYDEIWDKHATEDMIKGRKGPSHT